MFQKGPLWLNVLHVEKKLAHRKRLGRWQANQTRAAREQNLRSDSSNTAEKLSDLLWANEKSRLNTEHLIPFFFFIFNLKSFFRSTAYSFVALSLSILFILDSIVFVEISHSLAICLDESLRPQLTLSRF